MRVRIGLATTALVLLAVVALIGVAVAGAAPVHATSDDGTLTFVEDQGPIAPQVDGASEDDTRIPVMLWTLVAAGGAGGLGLILLVVRFAMGWDAHAPPPEEEGGGGH